MKKTLLAAAIMSAFMPSAEAITRVIIKYDNSGNLVTQKTIEMNSRVPPAALTPVLTMRPGKHYINNALFPRKTQTTLGRSTAVTDEPFSGLDGSGHCLHNDAYCPGRWPGEGPGIIGRNGGAMRIFSHFSHFSYDDPIVAPGRAGITHLHAFFGNTSTGGASTPVSIRTTGNSTSAGGTNNRSAYWVPALIYVCDTAGKISGSDFSDGIGCNPARNGEPILPRADSGLNVYYKGYFGIGAGPEDIQGYVAGQASTLWFTTHDIIPFPVGFRMIAGLPAATPPAPYPSPVANNANTQWVCETPSVELVTTYLPGTGSGTHQTTPCPSTTSDLKLVVPFPSCWIGSVSGVPVLDSPDHVSHIRYPNGDRGDDLYCPTGYDNQMPGVTYKLHYSLDTPQLRADSRFYRLSSDNYDTNWPAGYSAHGDWFNGWDVDIMAYFVANCLVLGLDCHDNMIGPSLSGTPGLWRRLTPPLGTSS